MSVRDQMRRVWPKRVRTRLTLLYSSLFLAGGIVLLGLTFALVSNSLQSVPKVTVQPKPSSALLLQCKQEVTAARSAGGKSGTHVPLPAKLNTRCKEAFEAGAIQGVTDSRNHTMHELELYSLLGLGLLTVASAGLGWVMAGRVLRPVHDITAAARRASEQHLGERLRLEGPRDELKELADTFDDMLDRLDFAFAAQRQFVANASHELRTPLTSMRTAIDVVLAKAEPTTEQLSAMAHKVRRSIDRAERIIEALLMLALSNQGLDVVEPVDLATAAEDALESVADVARTAGISVDSDLEPATVLGSRVLLERLVGNLVENAVVHNAPGGWLRLRSGTDEGESFIEVSNGGAVVDPDLVPHLVEPFQRANNRTGTGGVGLGLSIVQSVADAHGAEVSVDAPAAGGLVVRMTVPAATWNGRVSDERPAPAPA